jgi:hypothetical protein
VGCGWNCRAYGLTEGMPSSRFAFSTVKKEKEKKRKEKEEH